MNPTCCPKFVWAALALCLCLTGCHHGLTPATQQSLTTQPTEQLIPLKTVDATVTPPPGWTPEPLKQDEKHRHQIWLSPSGHTAYGVIYMALPLPAAFIPGGAETVLEEGFLPNMKKTEGKATLIGEVTDDPKRGGIRFVAEGGFYLVRAFLVLEGMHAWAVYAGTERSAPVNDNELKLAEQARERTVLGLHH